MQPGRQNRLHAAVRQQRRFDGNTLAGEVAAIFANEGEVAHRAPTEQANQLCNVMAGVSVKFALILRVSRVAERRNRGFDALTQTSGDVVTRLDQRGLRTRRRPRRPAGRRARDPARPSGGIGGHARIARREAGRGLERHPQVARIGPADARRLLILVSGTHGIEGFAGSGCHTGWLAEGLFARFEYRHDESNKRFFENRRGDPLSGQDVFATELIYAF